MKKIGIWWILMLTAQTPASAHGVKIEHRVAEAIEVEAVYDSGAPMANARVTVYAPDDPTNTYHAGNTDALGRFIFIPDANRVGIWEVKVRQAGHGAIAKIEIGKTEERRVTESQEQDTTAIQQSVAVSSTTEVSFWQKAIMAGAVVWGFVGTALFFFRIK